MTTTNAQRFPSYHSDYVHDIQFDFYGRRIATCSGDRNVKIWNLQPDGKFKADEAAADIVAVADVAHRSSSNNYMNEPANIQVHRSAVWRVSWAHPEFGQLLATCGADGSAKIWEESRVQVPSSVSGGLSVSDANVTTSHGNASVGNSSMASTSQSEITTSWVKKAELSEARRSVSCIQFAPKHLGLMIATGSADGSVRIYEAIDVMNLNHWPSKGIIEFPFVDKKSSELGVTSLSWCTGRFEPPTLVVGGGNGSVLVYRYSDDSRIWSLAVELKSHSKGVLDVSWAANVGRSYHLIASTGMDGKTMVHRLKRGKKENGEHFLELGSTQEINSSPSSSGVWRCRWNVTGTVLATSGDFGEVKLWKNDIRNHEWKCVSEVVGGELDGNTT